MDDYKKDVEDYFCRFSFGQFVTLIFLEIVTLFFVFYLGAKFGPDMIGGSSSSTLAQNNAERVDLPKDSPKIEDLVGKGGVEYTYPDVLTQKNGQKVPQAAIRVKSSGMTVDELEKTGQVAQDAPGIQVPSTPSLNPEVLSVPENSEPKIEVKKEALIAQQKVVEQVSEEARLAMQDTPVDAPVGTPASTKIEAFDENISQKGKFAIQVGSYPTMAEANAVLSKWKRKGYQASIVEAQVPEKGTWYRIRIGGYANKNLAQEKLAILKSKEKVNAIIVAN